MALLPEEFPARANDARSAQSPVLPAGSCSREPGPEGQLHAELTSERPSLSHLRLTQRRSEHWLEGSWRCGAIGRSWCCVGGERTAPDRRAWYEPGRLRVNLRTLLGRPCQRRISCDRALSEQDGPSAL